MHSVSSNAVAAFFRKLNYLLTEHFTGKYWIDGKPIYSKTLECGALPNATQKYIACNIQNLERITKYEGFSMNAHYSLAIPYPSTDSSYTVEVFYNDGYLRLVTNTNRADFTDTYITIEYTKTTD